MSLSNCALVAVALLAPLASAGGPCAATETCDVSGSPGQNPLILEQPKKVAKIALKNKRRQQVTGPFKIDLGKVDVSKVAKLLTPDIWTAEAQKTNAFFRGRDDMIQTYKPGVQTLMLIFSDQKAENMYIFPWMHEELGKQVQALIDIALGEWYGLSHTANRTVRLQFARMNPGAWIIPHVDTGKWVQRVHRIHIPIITNEDYRFEVYMPSPALAIGDYDSDTKTGWEEIIMEEGRVFEINNGYKHRVTNNSTKERVHLLLDWSEKVIDDDYTLLSPGQECWYARRGGDVTCP